MVSCNNPLLSFEKIDFELLKKHFRVKLITISGHGVLELGRLIPKLLWADLAYCWFADFHALRTLSWCKRFRKKFIIIVGGYDIAHYPNISFGIASNRPGSLPMVQKTLDLADMVIANSKSIKNEVINNFDITSEKIQVIYHGIDSKQFSSRNAFTKEKVVLTVAFITMDNIKRKHLDIFVSAAKAFPDFEFWVVGPAHEDKALAKLQSLASKNVRFIGPLYGQDLVEAFQRAMVYVQISQHEGFGMALAEGMACACVPIVTDVTSLPEVAGNCGFYVEEGNLDSTVDGIRKAVKAPFTAGLAARDRIISKFPLERRAQGLLDIIKEIFVNLKADMKIRN